MCVLHLSFSLFYWTLNPKKSKNIWWDEELFVILQPKVKIYLITLNNKRLK